MTTNRILAIIALVLAVLSYFLGGPLLVLAVVCLALALLI
jgi:hypothetical protein